MTQARYTPPLGFAPLTPFYDTAIAALTREGVWRARLVRQIAARPGDNILDVGSGTGSLAIAVTAAEPRCRYRGIDPDASAVAIARRKADQAGSAASFEVGRFGGLADGEACEKVVCSLVLHQVPIAEKRRLLKNMFECLKPGGHLFVADYGAQRTLPMRLAFRLTVQLLDGRVNTQPNADGIIPLLVQEAGFQEAATLEAVNTPTGRIEIIRARRLLAVRTHQ